MKNGKWEALDVALDSGGEGHRFVLKFARELGRIDTTSEDGVGLLLTTRRRALAKSLDCGDESQVVRVCVSVLSDLRAQGWAVRARAGRVEIRMPVSSMDPAREKERVRAGLLIERDQQLRERPTRRFIRDLERRRIGPKGNWVSIFSLMRDGGDLASRLNEIRETADHGLRVKQLAELIQPYVQVVDDSTCEHTGLLLKDIWRYFRHTWTSPHKSLPGRSMWVLIRDAAAEHHPVIGIAAIGSAVVQLRIRDEWIGWTSEAFLERIHKEASERWARWIIERLDEQIHAIYVDDLIENGVIAASEIDRPTETTLSRLREVATTAREAHRLYGSSREHKSVSADTSRVDWVARARTHLFVWKRSDTLADLLEDKRALQGAGVYNASTEALRAAIGRAEGRRAVQRILRRVKAAHVGIDMLDITVAGSVPPYSHLLGGKLVSILLASSEVRRAYETRYAERASVIASSMAGRPVQRVPKLVLLGTTSLYGSGSSQYNRIRVPAGAVDARSAAEIRYIELGKTAGYGSFHFSGETIREIRALLAQNGNGRRVKHIFGEGSNPRMREVREALDLVGLPSDQLLQHGSPRIVYAIPLATNFREVLLDLDHHPEYILDHPDAPCASRRLSEYWCRRWLARRIDHDHVLAAVQSHRLSFPVQHGARVSLPDIADEAPLFGGYDEE